MAYARHNQSTTAAIFGTMVPFARGSFKNVWRGHYTDAPRRGEECVAKAFKTGSVFEDHFFELEVTVIEETQEIINAWNNARVFGWPVMLSIPQIWTYAATGEKCLVEPFISNFRKFNSNSGWVAFPGDRWSDALQALSHFSYHHSGGERMLCDIQGGVYSDRFILSDPAILSRTKSYGPADLGLKGIRDFFARHSCTRFCSPAWIRPGVTGPTTFSKRQGTTMTPHRPGVLPPQ